MPCAVAQVGGEGDLSEGLLLLAGDLAGVLGGAAPLQALEHLALPPGLDHAAALRGDLVLGGRQLGAGQVVLALGAGDEGVAGVEVVPGERRAVLGRARVPRGRSTLRGLAEGRLAAGLEGQLGRQLLLGRCSACSRRARTGSRLKMKVLGICGSVSSRIGAGLELGLLVEPRTGNRRPFPAIEGGRSAVGGHWRRPVYASALPTASSTRSGWNGLTTKSFAPDLIASSTLVSWPRAEHMTTRGARVERRGSPERGQAVLLGHGDVERHDVGLQVLVAGDGLVAVGAPRR